MKIITFLVLNVLLLSFQASAAQQKQSHKAPGEEWSVLEAEAQEAEKDNNWPAASIAYGRASNAARDNGELQKALSFGKKSLEIAEKIKDPRLQIGASNFPARIGC